MNPANQETISIDQLTEYDRNPRSIKDDQFNALCKNLLDYGFLDPLVVDQANVVLGGNQRLRAAKHLISQGHGEMFKEVPIYRITTESDEDRARISLILNNHHGEWDTNLLAGLITDFSIDLEELPDLGFDLPVIQGLNANLGEGDFKPIESANTFDDIAEKQRNKKIKCPECGAEFNPND